MADSSESIEFDMISGNVNCLERDGKSAVRGGAVSLSAEITDGGGWTEIWKKTSWNFTNTFLKVVTLKVIIFF